MRRQHRSPSRNISLHVLCLAAFCILSSAASLSAAFRFHQAGSFLLQQLETIAQLGSFFKLELLGRIGHSLLQAFYQAFKLVL